MRPVVIGRDHRGSGWVGDIGQGHCVADDKAGRPDIRPGGCGRCCHQTARKSWEQALVIVSGGIPTYYKPGRIVTLGTTPDHVLSLKLRTLVDDFEDFFLERAGGSIKIRGVPSHHLPSFASRGWNASAPASVAGLMTSRQQPWSSATISPAVIVEPG